MSLTNVKEPAQDRVDHSDLLSQGAQVFRSKLIQDFHLLESIQIVETSNEKPMYYTSDIEDPEKMLRLIQKQPYGLVNFQVYHTKNTGVITPNDRRRNRVKNKNSKWPPIDLWAHWVVKSDMFQNGILTLILINSVVLGVQAEVGDSRNPKFDMLRTILDIFDYCTLFIFLLEIILKWIDQFWLFWRNRWNIFDFFVTFLSFVPEIIRVSTGTFGKRNVTGSTGDLGVVASNMRTFRILRSLKVVSRFQKVRLIVLAVTKAFQAMVFITVLLFIFAYIFAIVGVMFFQQGYQDEEKRKLLRYPNSFTSVVNALITLFQIFTLDQWFSIFKDLTKVSDYFFAIFYIILWILIGSFIFNNIFVGIMVNNFQSIRNDLFVEVDNVLHAEERKAEMAEITEVLDQQAQQRNTTFNQDLLKPTESTEQADLDADGNKRTRSQLEVQEAISRNIMKGDRDSLEWQRVVEKNLVNLAKEEAHFFWPKDSLFRYYVIMEALQENIYERTEILNLAAEAINSIHDT